MSRFNKAFLRDRLGGRACLAAFGKHPAWNDHMGLTGAGTETLALLEDVLYRQGIAGQVAAGRWRDASGNPATPSFTHRFVWSRGEQSVIGAMWPSTDGKRRTQFPFVCCAQVAVGGAAAVQIYLEYVEQAGAQARNASNESEVQRILERGGCDLNRWKPIAPAASLPKMPPERQSEIRNALLSLIRRVTRSGSMVQQPLGADDQNGPLRVPPVGEQTRVNLWFYASFLEQFSPAPPLYLLLTGASAPVDCLLGPPGPNAFFCLGAGLEELPCSEPPNPATVPERWQQNVDRFIAACASGALPPAARRSFWQWFAPKRQRSRDA